MQSRSAITCHCNCSIHIIRDACAGSRNESRPELVEMVLNLQGAANVTLELLPVSILSWQRTLLTYSTSC